ncbi:MAG: hypothetical protein IKO41_00355 [Lachnospiraceae bacterium]|nr:hypothetical protein [Lachnospiraceae bacterium]
METPYVSSTQLWILFAIHIGIQGYADIGEFIWSDHVYASAKSRSGIGLKISATLSKMEKIGLVYSCWNNDYVRLSYYLTKSGIDQLHTALQEHFFYNDIAMRRKKLQETYKKGLLLESDYPKCISGLAYLESHLS